MSQIVGDPDVVVVGSPDDCVVSKLVAGREKDRAFANALIEVGLIDPAIVAARIDALEVDPRVMERLKRWIGMYTSAP